MKLIDTQKIGKPAPPKVMLKMDEDAAKAGFEMADKLRAFGFIVKLHLGGKGPADVDWKLEISSKSPNYVLTNVKTNKHLKFKSTEEVIEAIER
jgi:hypothetical protein